MDATLSMIAGQDQAGIRASAITRLAQINLDDLISSFGWQGRPFLSGLSRKLFHKAAQSFARQIVEFDTAVGRDGLVSAARSTLANYVRDIRIFGGEHIPTGSFLAVSNHPGMTDALSVFAALNRPDLLVVALQRPFLQALPHMSKQLSCLSERPCSHRSVVRQVSTHLRAGGAALSFPAGHIEPDPGVHGGAAKSLEAWAPNAGMFLRLAPQTAILPVLVRGVVWPKAVHGWMAGQRPAGTDREKAAAALQLLAHVALKVRPIGPSVEIGRPIYARDLTKAGMPAIHQALMAEMSDMIRHPASARKMTV